MFYFSLSSIGYDSITLRFLVFFRITTTTTDESSPQVIQKAILKTSLIAGVRQEDGLSLKDMMGKISASLDHSVSSPDATMQLAMNKALLSSLLSLLPPNAQPSPQSWKNVENRKNGKMSKSALNQFTEGDLLRGQVVIFAAAVQSIKVVKDIRIEQFKPSDAPSNDAFNSVYGDVSSSNR